MSDLIKSTSFLECGFTPNLFFMFASAASVGINIWVSFIAGPIMIRTIDRHTFLRIQSKMFPVYFLLNGICSITQLASIFSCNPSISALSETEHHAVCVCGASLLAALLNGFWIGRNTTKVLTKKMKMEKDEGCVYPNIAPALKKDKKYQAVLSAARKYHIASVLLGLGGTGLSFYMIYFMTKVFRG